VFSRRALAVLLFSATLSCSRAPKPAIERLAVLRFENLTPGAAPEWIGRALSEVVTAELSGPTGLYAIPSPRLHQLNTAMGPRPVTAPGISAEEPLAMAAGANRIGYGDYEVVQGRLRARLTVVDPATHRAVRGPIEVSAGPEDVIGAATALAKAISAQAQPFGTSNNAALESYARALEASDPAAAAAGAAQAIAADSNFGAPYAMLAEQRAKQQDRGGVESAIRSGMAHDAGMSPPDRVRLAVLNATLGGAAGSLEQALGAYVNTTPLDPAAWRALAQFESGRHRFAQAVQAYRRALEIEPEDAATWNELGYTAAYAGDLEGARAATRRYGELRPSDPNPLDSLGDIELMAGRLAEAERLYLEANKRSPGFLGGADIFKAAMARLMTGDVAGADGVAKQGSEQLAGSADWLWLTGRRKEAVAKLSASAPGMPRDGQAHGYAELTVWSLLLGDRETAARMAEKAAAAATPQTAGVIMVARFMAMPKADAAQWTARAAQMFPAPPQSSIKDYALAHALLLSEQFEAAVPVLTQLEARGQANGDRSAAIELAWALIRTGRWQEAAPLLRLNPVPSFGSTAIFAPFYFPRLYQLRAEVAEREGKTAEAAENRRIYTALGGQ
jgi:Flp pilus assembly protein TadD